MAASSEQHEIGHGENIRAAEFGQCYKSWLFSLSLHHWLDSPPLKGPPGKFAYLKKYKKMDLTLSPSATVFTFGSLGSAAKDDHIKTYIEQEDTFSL